MSNTLMFPLVPAGLVMVGMACCWPARGRWVAVLVAGTSELVGALFAG